MADDYFVFDLEQSFIIMSYVRKSILCRDANFYGLPVVTTENYKKF